MLPLPELLPVTGVSVSLDRLMVERNNQPVTVIQWNESMRESNNVESKSDPSETFRCVVLVSAIGEIPAGKPVSGKSLYWLLSRSSSIDGEL